MRSYLVYPQSTGTEQGRKGRLSVSQLPLCRDPRGYDVDPGRAICIFFSHFEVSLLRRWPAEMKDDYPFTDAQD